MNNKLTLIEQNEDFSDSEPVRLSIEEVIRYIDHYNWMERYHLAEQSRNSRKEVCPPNILVKNGRFNLAVTVNEKSGFLVYSNIPGHKSDYDGMTLDEIHELLEILLDGESDGGSIRPDPPVRETKPEISEKAKRVIIIAALFLFLAIITVAGIVQGRRAESRSADSENSSGSRTTRITRTIINGEVTETREVFPRKGKIISTRVNGFQDSTSRSPDTIRIIGKTEFEFTDYVRKMDGKGFMKQFYQTEYKNRKIWISEDYIVFYE